MKLLFDQNISYRIVNKLTETFADSKHVSHFGLNDSEDIDIWQFAKNENFTIVTFDSDYFDISLINGSPPKIIWLRTGNLTTNKIKELLISNILTIHDFIVDIENTNRSCLEIE